MAPWCRSGVDLGPGRSGSIRDLISGRSGVDLGLDLGSIGNRLRHDNQIWDPHVVELWLNLSIFIFMSKNAVLIEECLFE